MKNCNTNRRQTARCILRVARVAALGMVCAMALPQAAQAQGVIPPPVPTDIQVPATSEAFLLGRGVGTQNYICAPSRSIGRVAWTLFTPQATLFDDDGAQLITHFFSPNPKDRIVRVAWQDSGDTSTVWGEVAKPSSDANFVAPGAIPWLLIRIVGAAAGPTGGDTLSKTTFIQRLNTVGGVAPSTGCALPTDIGRKAFVPYEADYFFYQN